MRDNLTEFVEDRDNVLNKYAEKKVHMFSRYTGIKKLPQWKWSESLARAARHVLNEEGACNTQGSHYAETFPEALSKYYSYEVENLEYLTLESLHFAGKYKFPVNDDPEIDITEPVDPAFSGYATLNYIFSQNHIDPSLFFSKTAKHFGIGCACVPTTGKIPIYKCIFATATKLMGRDVRQRLPIWQALLNPKEACSKRCQYKPFVMELDPMFADTPNTNSAPQVIVDWLPTFFSNAENCGGFLEYEELYNKEDQLRFIDKSHFCTTCNDINYGCSSCETGRFKSNAETCYTCKVPSGKYKNHMYPATRLGDTSTYDVYNYLRAYDHAPSYGINITKDYADEL